MITSSDPKSNGMLLALQQQRDGAMEMSALLSGELAERATQLAQANAKIDELQARLDALKPKEVTT